MSYPHIRIKFLAMLLLLLVSSNAFALSARFISQVVPQNMQAGKSYSIAIQFRNNGSDTWVAGNQISLRMRKSSDARLWKYEDTGFSEKRVAKGEIATFQFTLQAPDQAGEYSLQWQLYDSQQGSFGDFTPSSLITVGSAEISYSAEFVMQKVPGLKQLGQYYSILEPNKVYPITMLFKNKGKQPWKIGQVKLVAINPPKNMTWSLDEVDLSSAIAPDEIKTVTFKIITPSKPGIYHFQWQLFTQSAGFFGEPSDDVAITVR